VPKGGSGMASRQPRTASSVIKSQRSLIITSWLLVPIPGRCGGSGTSLSSASALTPQSKGTDPGSTGGSTVKQGELQTPLFALVAWGTLEGV
jgi:hypothetical protein